MALVDSCMYFTSHTKQAHEKYKKDALLIIPVYTQHICKQERQMLGRYSQ